MRLTYKDLDESRLCPFRANILVHNSARRTRFNFMIFTPEHCRINSGTETDIEFFCDGAAVKASAARQNETSGPARLCIVAGNPFNDRNLALFLSQHKLESLHLYMIELNSEVSCRAVATAQVRFLTLDCCDLEDGGAALVELVRQGRGAKELCFLGNPFGASESFFSFINALKGDEYLERLNFPVIHDRQETRALAAQLHENKGLVYLTVYFRALDDSDWVELLDALSLHPRYCVLLN
jgi:hypothetical protein